MVIKGQLKTTDPDEVLDWEVSKVEEALKALDITIGKKWSKAKKANELNQAIKQMNADTKVDSAITAQDTNHMMLQMFQKMQEQTAEQLAHEREKSEAQAQAMQEQTQLLASQMDAIAEKIGSTPEANNSGGGNRSRAKGRHPEKIERDIDYASFLQWEKSWNLYVTSDRLDTLPQREDRHFLQFFFKGTSERSTVSFQDRH